VDVEYQSAAHAYTRLTRSRMPRRQMPSFCAVCRVEEMGLTPLFDALDEVGPDFLTVTRELNGRLLLAMARVSRA
jgi:hypothetical protein